MNIKKYLTYTLFGICTAGLIITSIMSVHLGIIGFGGVLLVMLVYKLNEFMSELNKW